MLGNMIRQRIVLIAGLGIAIASTAVAASKAGVTMPDQATVAGKTLVLNGLGLREATVFNVKVYVAALYLEAKTSDPQAILSEKAAKRLVLHFVRDVDAGDMVDAFHEGFEKNGAGKALDQRIAKLVGWMVDLKVGDELSMTYVPESGVEIAVNGKAKGTIAGADFQKPLFAIWVGPQPPNAGLKTGLLGK